MGSTEETAPYIKQHDQNTICFADTLVQAKNALERKNITQDDAKNLDGAHLMLFGVESWKKSDMKDFRGAMKAATNNFERFEIFGCEMDDTAQLEFGALLDPENLSNVKQFDLDNTVIKPAGAAAIFSKIAEVPSIEILNLQGSIAGNTATMAAIDQAMVQDSNIFKCLYKIDLKINELKPDAGESVGRLISRINTHSLHEDPEKGEAIVDLFYNDLQAEGVLHIAQALKLDDCMITHLDLCCNNIGDAGAKHIASMLRTNTSLKILKLALNNIGTGGGVDIMKALAPAPTDKNQAKNRSLRVLDISANVMKDDGDKETEKSEKDKKLQLQANAYDTEMAKLCDEDGNVLEENRVEHKKIEELKDAIIYQMSGNEDMPLVQAIGRVCIGSHLQEFDFTGVELGNSQWDALGHHLSTTHNETFQKHEERMTMRFSIVDLMNEQNLKVLEKHIWDGPAKDRYKHIDWRRRDEKKDEAK